MCVEMSPAQTTIKQWRKMNEAPDTLTDAICGRSEPILVTGASGFLGRYIVARLAFYGFEHIRCLTRRHDFEPWLTVVDCGNPKAAFTVVGDLRSRAQCANLVRDVRVIYHAAADVAGKSFAGVFYNTVVATRNLVEAALESGTLLRFVNVGSFASYSNRKLRRGAILDETCPLEAEYQRIYSPYVFAKTEQDLLIMDYGEKRGLPYTIVRPGAVFGPGAKERITSRVGISPFGFFMHLGGRNELPLTYVENCADAVVRAGLIPGIEGRIYNIVDGYGLRSCQFLRWYRKNIHRFFFIPVPYPLFYFISAVWENFSHRRHGQIPPVFNRLRASATWKGNRYSNARAQRDLRWRPHVHLETALQRYAAYWKAKQ